MGGLGHYLEEEGVATTQISLIYEHTAKIRPPRALWVPFALGRPFGTPERSAFQQRVLHAALALLERGQGPVLEAFPEEAPQEDVAGWSPPVRFTAQDSQASEQRRASLAATLEREVATLRGPYGHSLARRGRTAVGVSRIAIEALPDFVAAFLERLPQNPRDDIRLGLTFRFAVEDLKMYYFEAATAQGAGVPASALHQWLWYETALGETMRSLAPLLAESEDRVVQRVAGILLRAPARS